MKPLATLPRLEVDLAGRPLADSLARDLGQVRARHELARPTQCELVFRTASLTTADDTSTLPRVGEALRVGIAGHRRALFEGEVTAVELRYGPEGQAELRLRGYDLLHRLRKRQPVRVHVETTVADLARELVADLGLSVVAPVTGPLLERLLQHRSNDLQLLVDQAAVYGLYPVLRGSTLHLLTLEGVGEALPLKVGDSLLEARFELNGEPACRSVEVSAWDPSRVEAHRGAARRARVGREVVAEAPPERLGGNGKRTLGGRLANSDATAEAMAQGELDRRIAAEVTLWALAEGDPELCPGRPIEVAGALPDFCGRYVPSAVEHRIDAVAGFVTELSTAPPMPPPRTTARGADAAWGTVSRVDDPQGLGRVKVELSARGELGDTGLETGWLQVVCPGAGEGKGLVALPDVDDRVLVLLLDGETAHGVVLGGLYGARRPYDAGVEKGRVRRYGLRTPGGQWLRLDDLGHTLRLENDGGSFLELGPDRAHLFSTTDLVIEAPKRKVKIRGKIIDFERA